MLASYTYVFAEETIVPIEDYMYDAKTVYVDDDIEGGSMYPISMSLSGSNTVTEESGNTAVKRTNWDSIELIRAGNFIDADKVVVSFGVKPSGASFDEAVSGGAFDKTKRGFIAYGIYAGGSGEAGKLGQYSGTSIGDGPQSLKGWMTWGKGGYISVPQTNDENDGYVKVAAVFERVMDEDTGAYTVYMRNLYFNGNDVLTDALKEGTSTVANWWSDDKGPTFKLQNRTGSGTHDNYYDNFLIYAAEDFKIKNMEYSDDSSSAKMNFTLGINSDEVKADIISEDGTFNCSAEAGDSKKELLINLPDGIDLENQSYYISINGIKSVNGETLNNAKYLVSQKSAEVKSVSASKSETEVNGEFIIDAVDDKTVFAVMSVWDENNNCIDFSVKDVQLDSSAGEVPVELKVESDDMSSANKVQMFFVDSIENMKLVSEVSDIELQ